MQETKRILSIDGGGIKGVMPAAFLASIEQTTGKRIIDHFDLIAGASTGGIIALGLGLGMSATEILAFYENDGSSIFAQNSTAGHWRQRLGDWISRQAHSAKQWFAPKYNSAALYDALCNVFEAKILGDSKTRLLIPAFDRQRRTVHVFKTAHHERFLTDWRESAVNVALATAAAPTYLPSHRMDSGISLLDGGIWANNPAGAAVVEAIGVLGWPATRLQVLSLGCTEAPLDIPENAGRLALARKVTDIFLLGQASASLGTAKLLMGRERLNDRFHRIQQPVPDDLFKLDATQQIKNLKGLGASLAREHLPAIRSTFLVAPTDTFRPVYHAECI